MQSRDEVAIVGYACRLPGASDIDRYWKLLAENRCSVSRITEDRFSTWNLFHPAADQRGRSYTFAAGVIDDVWGFDATAFGMSPREAEQVDPQQRHLLEVAFDALTHAGIRPGGLAGTDTGVYIGASSADYATRFFADPNVADVHMMTGNSASIISNRLSYTLDLRGPSLTIDTACSSSLVGLHVAAEAIRNGTIDTAIVGGVNLLLSPFSYVGFSRASMLSPTGLCRPFDAGADGYVRSEGIIAVVLRSMAQARKERNRIHGVIVASGINQDGRTTGLSLPSAASQRQLLEQVYGKFGIDPCDLVYVEAHGTGTIVGDPIEADALGKALAQARATPLPIGSVKSNIGHLEPVSGLAGLVKSLAALAHDVVPATLHQQAPNEHIPFDELNLRVVNRNWNIQDYRGAKLVGVNSFGFGGTNSHAVLRSDTAPTRVLQFPRSKITAPLAVTAHAKDVLPVMARALEAKFPHDTASAQEYISGNAHLRDLLPHRVLITGESVEDIRKQLSALASGGPTEELLSGHALGHNLPVAFLFSGNGGQWVGMGHAAWKTSRAFREALQEIDRAFAKRLGWSVVEALFSETLEGKIQRATYAQPLLLALQVAIVRSLEDAGVVPAATLGHSVGEIAAAWAAGGLSLPQAIDVVAARSRHQEAAYGRGTMAAIMLSEREAKHLLSAIDVPNTAIAAINSWRSVTVSGTREEIDKILTRAAELRISARPIDVAYPFHSALIDSVRAPLLRELEGLKPHALRRPMVSSVTGKVVAGDELGADHWWQNVRIPVQFEAGLATLIEKDICVFVEIGPKPILSAYVRDGLRDLGKRGAFIETLTEADHKDAIDRATSKIFIAGGAVDPQRFFGPPPSTAVELPRYPWAHVPFAVKDTVESSTVLVPPRHALLGRPMRTDSGQWFSAVDPVLFPWLNDHKVGDATVFPAMAFVEVMLAAGQQLHGGGALELRDVDIVHPLILDARTCFETQVRVASETGLIEFLSRARNTPAAEWRLHARGLLSKSPAGEAAAFLPTSDGVAVIKDKVYECATALGFTYGPVFRRLRQVRFPEPKFAVATFDPVSPELPDWLATDLTALDSAFHALLASEEAGVADMPMKLMLPVRLGSLQYYKPGTSATHVTARTIRQSPTSLVVNFALYSAVGECIARVEAVRLVEAPSYSSSSANLTYHITDWDLDHPSQTAVSLPKAELRLDHQSEPSTLREGLLLLEAGCLRIAWTALQIPAAPRREPGLDSTAESNEPWRDHYRSALLWHLESHGLASASSETDTLAPYCPLPDVDAIVQSLAVRHPTMTSEMSALSFLVEALPDVVSECTSSSVDHIRRLGRGLISAQSVPLREALEANVQRSIASVSTRQLLRLLMIGTAHLEVAQHLSRAFGNIEIVVSDLDSATVEQAQLGLAADFPRIRCIPWTAVQQLDVAYFDLAFAVDSLSQLSALDRGLDSVTRLLRRGAPIFAAELCPHIFWDIVRGVQPSWWARSANAQSPVGALLTAQEWEDEFRAAGLGDVRTCEILPGGEIGVVVMGVVTASQVQAPVAELPELIWDLAGSEGDISRALKAALLKAGVSLLLPPHSSNDRICIVDASTPAAEDVENLTRVLSYIGGICRTVADKPGCLWVVLDFGRRIDVDPLSDPIWCAIAAALRVVQNEYSGLTIKTLGLAGLESVETAVREILSSDKESEIFIRAGKRVVFRVRHGLPPKPRSSDEEVESGTQLVNRRSMDRSALEWISTPRRELERDDVEISVSATGLNFRDVMWNMRLLPEEALEDGYAGTGLGMECAGVVSRVGSSVDSLRIGDRVIAFAPRAFQSHTIVRESAVCHIPADMTFEAACTIPVAFITAYYGLAHLARLSKGDVVLIHGAAGGVGIAAIQIARYLGATIVATAGSEEKRAFLRSYGADLVCDSRTLAFCEEVRRFTNGKGVDVVLNSVAGEAMVRTMECLRPFGRFIELGKRDFFFNTHIPLRPMRRNISYFGVDVDQLMGEHSELAQRLFGEVVSLLRSGDLVPLPHRIFPGEHAQEAFRLMQRSGHIGKIVVTPKRVADRSPALASLEVDPSAAHVVIGGTRGFGLATAQWLASKGATRLILASRSGQPADDDLAKIEQLRGSGVDVSIARLDIADRDAVASAFARWNRASPIKGIVHAAMVLDDGLIERMDAAAIDRVLRPKIAGAANLEAAAAALSLDYLLMYSSATTYFGNPGQYNYVAANGFLEGLARRMRTRGIPAYAVAWGAIEDAGYLARNIAADAALKGRFSGNFIPAGIALEALDAAWSDAALGTPSFAIARIDWTVARRSLAALRAPAFGSVATEGGHRPSTDATAILESLKGRPVEEIVETLTDIVAGEIARVLRLPRKEVDHHRNLADIGMDSLMMLELRMTVESSLQIDLPMLSLSSGITPAEIARRVAPLVAGQAQQTVPSTIVALSTSHISRDAEESETELRDAALDALMSKVREMDRTS